MSENNPYTPPESDPQPPRQGQSFIREFPRFPVLLFIGIALLTMGLYVYAWIYTRNQMINRCVPESKRIPSWLTNSVIALGVVSFSMSFLAMVSPESSFGKALIEAQGIFTLITYAMTILWLFNFRALLNQLAGSQPGERFWVNGILLVLFSVYYLQYKINQLHDFGDHSTPPSSGGDDSEGKEQSAEETSKKGYIEL